MVEETCMTFVHGRTHEDIATVQLSDSPIPRIGEEVEMPAGISSSASRFKVAKVTYHYRHHKRASDRSFDPDVTVLLEEA